MRIAILTVSDAGAAGARVDRSGDAIAAWAAARGDEITARAIVPDETGRIAAALVGWCDADVADLVLTTGGTGLAWRDVTPEATRAALEREAPGIAERIRLLSLERFPRAALSRGTAGVRGRTLVVNLPGSTGGVTDGLLALDAIVDHATDILRDRPTDHSGAGAAGGAATGGAASRGRWKRRHCRAMKVLLTLTDVEPAVRLNAMLEKERIETAVVSPMDDVRAAIRREKPDLIVLTGALVDPANVALVKQQLWEGIAVVGLADIAEPHLVERLRALGYVEVWPKPVVLEEVFDGIRGILERRRLASLTGLSGESEAVREVLVKVEQIAPVSSTVLVEGESGTGKELVARAIHLLSPRRGRPFIPINVGALPETLLESELFGHEKGAFTGAAERRIGRFELADSGTLFLDEIGDIPPATQVKLLRVLEDREVTRVGGTQHFRVDCRVVTATNRSLREQVEEGSFRSDLYYRLNVLRIYLPPLRERRQDIPILVRRFVSTLTKAHDRTFHGISADAMQLLVDYPWPGNVRELRNLVESMVVLSPGHELRPEDLPRQIREGAGARLLPVHVGPVVRGQEGAAGRELEFILRSLVELKLQVEELRRRIDDERAERERWLASGGLPALGAGSMVEALEPRDQAPPPNTITLRPGMSMAEIERAAIESALRETRGNRRRAAEMLGIGERTLYRKLREYQMPESLGVPE